MTDSAKLGALFRLAAEAETYGAFELPGSITPDAMEELTARILRGRKDVTSESDYDHPIDPERLNYTYGL